MTAPIILILDNNRTDLELLIQQFEDEGFVAVGVSGLEEMDSAIGEREAIDLAILNVTGFDNNIWERCARLHEARIPFIIIMTQRSSEIQRESMKYGASCLLIKPLATKDLIEHVHAVLGD